MAKECRSLWRRREWFTVSKAAERSRRARMDTLSSTEAVHKGILSTMGCFAGCKSLQKQVLLLLCPWNQPLCRRWTRQCHCHTCGRKIADTQHCCQCILARWGELFAQGLDQTLRCTCSDLQVQEKKCSQNCVCYKVEIFDQIQNVTKKIDKKTQL